MEVHESKTGAAAIARRAARNPTQLLVSLVEDDPTASTERLFKNWCAIVEGNDDYLSAALRHAFTNILSSIDRDQRKSRPGSVAITEAERRERIEVAKEAVIGKLLTLNFVMPNGNKLGECTGLEVAKFGGIFIAIGKKAGKQLVGKVIKSDEQLRALK